MTRTRRPAKRDDGAMILPLALVVRGLSQRERREQAHEKARWFKARGIDPNDWSRVYPILLASWKVHGIESALDRARRDHEKRGRTTPST